MPGFNPEKPLHLYSMEVELKMNKDEREPQINQPDPDDNWEANYCDYLNGRGNQNE